MAVLRRFPVVLSRVQARRLWLSVQGLDRPAPFGDGPDATLAAIRQLGYVQIDTINVIERSHHHILHTRIPAYRREHLRQAQAVDKSIFEYWTHALSYVPVDHLRFFLPAMRARRKDPGTWFTGVAKEDVDKVLSRIRSDGPLSIRDIDDDVLVEKDHPWASRKPSKRALQLAFFRGDLVISERSGMVKTYELMDRHFGWSEAPRAASPAQVDAYRLDRALRAQGIVSLASVCYLDNSRKAEIRALIEARVRRRVLVPVRIEEAPDLELWAEPTQLDALPSDPAPLVHILSPFDPLVIQRQRLEVLFGYTHRFEAYVPKDRRILGYFALPVLVDDDVVAAIDLKADRARRDLLIQQRTWVGNGGQQAHKPAIEEALGRFERFQFAAPD